jgi:hypothetical protein
MEYSDKFEMFWKAYPNKKSKGYCYKKWVELKRKGELPDIRTIVMAINNQKKERIMLRGKNRFVPEWKHASTWLNQGCWDDACEIYEEEPIAQKKLNPIDRMWEGYTILRDYGPDQFRKFCQKTNMPDDDMEAVLNKFNMSFNLEPLIKDMFR